MGKKSKQVEGQLLLDICLDTQNYVVQSNRLVEAKQNLKLNSAKVMRAIIMQIKYEDDEFKQYFISIKELAKLLNSSTANLYRDIDGITDDIIENPVKMKDNTGKFIKIPWVSACKYDNSVGLVVQINSLLKPYLLNLKDNYAQYQLENILSMKSIYGIRLYELLQRKIELKKLPKDGVYVMMTIKYIREACSCEDKYQKISQFKSRVIETAVKEINDKTMLHVDYDYIKNGRTTEAINFHVNANYH